MAGKGGNEGSDFRFEDLSCGSQWLLGTVDGNRRVVGGMIQWLREDLIREGFAESCDRACQEHPRIAEKLREIFRDGQEALQEKVYRFSDPFPMDRDMVVFIFIMCHLAGVGARERGFRCPEAIKAKRYLDRFVDPGLVSLSDTPSRQELLSRLEDVDVLLEEIQELPPPRRRRKSRAKQETVEIRDRAIVKFFGENPRPSVSRLVLYLDHLGVGLGQRQVERYQRKLRKAGEL